ncbi:hypothetical protein [Aestuariivivens sediminis]|uniref:hypothetical protein n=1 Tax=Aestuariivivens sediminis TaxID=2913557 RepID=UPI001F5636C2|nr:hypothetical protein [Aestuariivivens sediminis]
MIISCSSSDNDESDNGSFLQQHHNTVWEYSYTNQNTFHQNTDYIKFKNDATAPFKEWYGHYEDNSCFEFIFHTPDYETVTILDNSENKLIVEFNSIIYDDKQVQTIIRSNEVLKINVVDIEYGNVISNDDYVYTKSTFNVDGITCEYD